MLRIHTHPEPTHNTCTTHAGPRPSNKTLLNLIYEIMPFSLLDNPGRKAVMFWLKIWWNHAWCQTSLHGSLHTIDFTVFFCSVSGNLYDCMTLQLNGRDKSPISSVARGDSAKCAALLNLTSQVVRCCKTPAKCTSLPASWLICRFLSQ